MIFSRKVILVFMLAASTISCAEPGLRDFDSEIWKSGNYTARAAMVRDINRNHLGELKNRSQALELLEKPDFKFNNLGMIVWRYKIITSLKCRIVWSCGAEISFDEKTGEIMGEILTYD